MTQRKCGVCRSALVATSLGPVCPRASCVGSRYFCTLPMTDGPGGSRVVDGQIKSGPRSEVQSPRRPNTHNRKGL